MVLKLSKMGYFSLSPTVYKDKKIIVLDAEGTELWSYKYFPITSILVSPSGDYVIEQSDHELGGDSTTSSRLILGVSCFSPPLMGGD